MEAGNSQQSNPSDDNTMIDTMILARQEREKQGLWETEVSYGGEADLHRHYDACEKNPTHLKFVPVDTFNINHLPPGCNDEDLVDLVRAMSDLTVRVSVKYVSERRPDIFPGSDKTYPCYKNRGSDMMRVGTGWVDNVKTYQRKDRKHNLICKCKECLSSPAPKTQFAAIYIRTAAHVVYDDLEGAHATCHLFFDRGGTPDACSDAIALNGMVDVWSLIDLDSSCMLYVTHDLDLADKLLKMLSRRSNLRSSVNKTYSNKKSHPDVYNQQESRPAPDLWENLLIIISHPHGCSKQVSVGQCAINDTIVDDKGDELSMYTYTTATCPGSSGAPVYKIDQLDNFSGHVHCGSCDGDLELNHSCYSENISDFPFSRMWAKDHGVPRSVKEERQIFTDISMLVTPIQIT